jgi:hypothetical protein
MLARLHIALPFAFTVPDGEAYSIYVYEDEGYEIRIYPPKRSDQPSPNTVADGIYIDEKLAFQANGLRIDFRKDDFDRRTGVECDPPYHLMQRTVNFFLRKVRFVTRGFQVTSVNFPQVPWRLRYLNDDETELETVEGLVKERGTIAFSFSWIVITPSIWDDIHRLDVDYAPPEWDSLYLDAVATLPDIGPSIVLAVTSLEVFISHVLDALAIKKVAPPQLWDWINNREWLREPTVEEQFDNLLKFLLGSSLKENSTLWEAFKNLKAARNSFVHDGVAQIGKKPVTEDEARRLVEHAAKIISFIRAKLPEELRWPEYQHKINIRIDKKLLGG